MNNPYAFTQLFQNNFDLNQWFATQRRNIEALSAANQAIVEGTQEVARRQAEVMRKNVENTLKASRDMFSGGTPEASLTKHAELTKDMFQSALENLREATETLTKVSLEAFSEIQQRATDSMEELSKAAGTPKKKAAA